MLGAVVFVTSAIEGGENFEGVFSGWVRDDTGIPTGLIVVEDGTVKSVQFPRIRFHLQQQEPPHADVSQENESP